MPRKRVCAANCESFKKLFSFPCDEKRRKLWAELLSIEDSTRPYLYACDSHFTEKQYAWARLSYKAIPDMSLPQPPTSNKEEQIKKPDKLPSLKVKSLENDHEYIIEEYLSKIENDLQSGGKHNEELAPRDDTIDSNADDGPDDENVDNDTNINFAHKHVQTDRSLNNLSPNEIIMVHMIRKLKNYMREQEQKIPKIQVKKSKLSA